MQFPAYPVGSKFENYLMHICFSAVRLFISDLGNVCERAYINFPTLLIFLGGHFCSGSWKCLSERVCPSTEHAYVFSGECLLSVCLSVLMFFLFFESACFSGLRNCLFFERLGFWTSEFVCPGVHMFSWSATQILYVFSGHIFIFGGFSRNFFLFLEADKVFRNLVFDSK
jgi:hypothetical protein